MSGEETAAQRPFTATPKDSEFRNFLLNIVTKKAEMSYLFLLHGLRSLRTKQYAHRRNTNSTDNILKKKQ